MIRFVIRGFLSFLRSADLSKLLVLLALVLVVRYVMQVWKRIGGK